ncbi:MAG: hypothetical protein JO277_15950 [Candidatus Eremiobacteraeota bacterium]|nr:hypothetical protein [Candidatus Eremiobacteraeota bacterium]
MKRYLGIALCAVAAACEGRPTALPAGALGPRVGGHPTPVVYVAESCVPNAASCAPADGLVRSLRGRTITAGVVHPIALAAGANGDLFVSNAVGSESGDVTVYSANGRLLRTLDGFRGRSYAMAVSHSGELYVISNYKYRCCDIKGSVAAFAPGGTRPVRHLTGVGSFPGKPAFDAYGNLYVPNFDNFPGYVGVYAPSRTAPFRTISQGIGFPLALAFDARGRLYVLNIVFSGGYDVAVYAPGADAPSHTIEAGITNASAIALDPDGNLYVANRAEKGRLANVTAYSPQSFAPARRIFAGIADPIALAFDAAGTLYVANAPVRGTSTVTAYAPGSVKPLRVYPLAEQAAALAVSHE